MPGTSRLGSRLVYRLPGPSTTRSADGSPRPRRRWPRTSAGADPDTRRMPGAHDHATGRQPRPSASSAWSVSGTGATGTTWPRTASTWLDGRTPSSKSPAMSRQRRDEQVAERVAAETRPRARALVREPVLEQAGHGRLGVREGRDAVADVAHRRRCPSSSRSLPDEPPSSATVTTAVMLLVSSLRPRSSVDWPGAAADGHDPRAARQRALLVDSSTSGCFAAGNGSRSTSSRRRRPTTKMATPTTRSTTARSQAGRNWRLGPGRTSWPARRRRALPERAAG